MLATSKAVITAIGNNSQTKQRRDAGSRISIIWRMEFRTFLVLLFNGDQLSHLTIDAGSRVGNRSSLRIVYWQQKPEMLSINFMLYAL
jgi:hypothetical protein